MGYYVQIDTQKPTDLASNQGYGDFIKWTETLSPHDYATLHHLTEFGWEQRVPQLIQELNMALKQNAPKQADVLSTAQNLFDVLRIGAKNAVVVSVTNGIGAGSPNDQMNAYLRGDEE